MHRIWVQQKSRLIRFLGKEIWGALIIKHCDAVYFRDGKKDLGRVANFVILEYERRNLFDFGQKYKSFKRNHYFNYLYKMRLALKFRRYVSKFYFRPQKNFSEAFEYRSDYGSYWFNRLNPTLRRDFLYKNIPKYVFWVGYISVLHFFLSSWRRQIHWLLKLRHRFGTRFILPNPPEKVRRRRVINSFFIYRQRKLQYLKSKLNKHDKRRRSCLLKSPSNFFFFWINKTKIKDKKTGESHRITKKEILTFQQPKIYNTTNYLKWISSVIKRKYNFRFFVRKRQYLTRGIEQIRKRLRHYKSVGRRIYENWQSLSITHPRYKVEQHWYDLYRRHYIRWLQHYNLKKAKRRVLWRMGKRALQRRRRMSSFLKWLAKRRRLRAYKPGSYKIEKKYNWVRDKKEKAKLTPSLFDYPAFFYWLFSFYKKTPGFSITSFSKQTMVGRAFVVSKKENIKILTKVNSWFIFNVTSNYNVVRDTSVLVKNLKQLGAINKDINYLFFTGPSPYSEYSQQTMAFSPFAIFKQFLLQLRLPIRTTRWIPRKMIYSKLTRGRLTQAIQQTLLWKKIGWLYYRLKDRRDLLLQLKYIVIRLRLGDYEEGFRIPYQQNDNRKRTKKEFRRLEVYRLRTFYGVFNLNEFKSYYYAILNTYKGYSKAAFLMLLECRPINILNVLNVFPSIYFINQYLEHFSVEFPDSSENPSSHAPLSVGDILMLPIMSYWRCINTLFFRLLHYRALLNFPNFLEVNYNILAAAVVSKPRVSQLNKPFGSSWSEFDIHTLVRNV